MNFECFGNEPNNLLLCLTWKPNGFRIQLNALKPLIFLSTDHNL